MTKEDRIEKLLNQFQQELEYLYVLKHKGLAEDYDYDKSANIKAEIIKLVRKGKVK